jgi:thiol-disulfide isomerase/thioredoxin
MKYLPIISLIISFVFPDIKIGDSAPSFFLRTIDDKNFFLSQQIDKGDAMVFSFFATWCVPCRKELPILDSLKTVFPMTQFYLINVSGLSQNRSQKKEDPKLVRKMLSSLKVNIPVLMDKYGVTAKSYGITELPYLVIIGKEGKILYLHSGYTPGDEQKLINVLSDLKNE